MFICYHTHQEYAVMGDSLDEAFAKAKDEFDDHGLELYMFYEIDEEIKVEQKLVPVVVKAKKPVNKLPK